MILIPQTPSSPTSPLLVLDLGFLTFKSDLRDVKKETNYERSESDFYDKFNLSLKTIKLLLVPNMDSNWKNPQVKI